jgi:hypothetical protein
MLIKPLKTLDFKGIKKQSFRNISVCQTQVKNSKEYGKTLTLAGKRLRVYLSDIQNVFQVGVKNVLATAIEYTNSLWCNRLSNI